MIYQYICDQIDHDDRQQTLEWECHSLFVTHSARYRPLAITGASKQLGQEFLAVLLRQGSRLCRAVGVCTSDVMAMEKSPSPQIFTIMTDVTVDLLPDEARLFNPGPLKVIDHLDAAILGTYTGSTDVSAAWMQFSFLPSESDHSDALVRYPLRLELLQESMDRIEAVLSRIFMSERCLTFGHFVIAADQLSALKPMEATRVRRGASHRWEEMIHFRVTRDRILRGRISNSSAQC